MRSFEERKAEVFLRSENRIKERKIRRNRILSFCIPLCLVTAAWMILVLPAMLPAGKSNDIVGESADVSENTASTVSSFVCVELSAKTETEKLLLRVDDADEVARIYQDIQTNFESSDVGSEESVEEDSLDEEETDDKMDFLQSGINTLSSGFEIVFTAENGTQTVYSLLGDELISETTGKKTVLTEDQRSNLMKMLGLTVTWEEDLQ